MRADAILKPLVLAAAGAASSCSVADNLTYDEIVTELDGIVTVAGEGDGRAIHYADEAPVSAWYMRQFWLEPFHWVLGFTFGARGMAKLENPSGHVRQLLQELPDQLDDDVLTCAQAAIRFGWIAELDANGNSRVVALDGLARVADLIDAPVFPTGFETLVANADPARLSAARTGVQAHRPEARGGVPLGDAGVEQYRSALGALVERPLPDWSQRLLVTQDLTEILRVETDARVRGDVENALRTAIGHQVREVLLRAVAARDRRLVEVRLCAMELVRRLGGPRTVPWLLAVMSASPSDMARGMPRFDPDSLVQLRLIRYCGQLRGELADAEVRLVGRDEWQSLAPADFLAQVVLNEQDYYSKLRVPAITALSLCLGRARLDPNPEWVREWQRERRRRS